MHHGAHGLDVSSCIPPNLLPHLRARLRLRLVLLPILSILGAAGCGTIPVGRGSSGEPREEAASPAGPTKARGPFGLPPISELLSDTPPPDDESAEFPDEERDPDAPDIREPGPDTANFPNSAFTLPQGRYYVEVSPVFLSGPSV